MKSSYLYLVVNCKTCGNINAMKYLGPDTGAPQITVPEKLQVNYTCGACGAVHDYLVVEMRVEKLSDPPPAGWEKSEVPPRLNPN